VPDQPTSCQLYAVIEAAPDAPERLSAALEAAEVAAVLLVPAAGEQLEAAACKPLVELARKAGVAALILADAQLARALRADGVHLGTLKDLQVAYRAAREVLGSGSVVGADAGISRHAAMLLAEAGADYVGFGAPAHLKDREKARTRRGELVSWWAEIFQVPCVAFDVDTPADAGSLAARGADFIAITLSPRLSPAATRDMVRDIAAAIRGSGRRAEEPSHGRAARLGAAGIDGGAAGGRRPCRCRDQPLESRVDGPAAPLEKEAAGRARQAWPPVKVIKTTPAPAEKGPPAALPPPKRASTHVKTPAPADDAAYEAFDKGLYLTALELGLKAAERGEPQAHTLVGRIYSEGLGIAKNEPLAAQWFARGAQLGDPEAMFAYGVMLAEGRGVDKDRSEAARHFEAAAARKHALANYNLALLFLKGDGKPENPYRALAHMRFAAESGVAAAQYDLGTMYATGTGTNPNAFDAAKWIGKAAVAGHAEAQLDYALILFRGHGVPYDPKRGAEFFRQAAEKGVATAQNRLARCYAHGAGVDRNLVEAAKWNFIARAGGIQDDGLEKLLAKLSQADRTKALVSAQHWRDRLTVGLTSVPDAQCMKRTRLPQPRPDRRVRRSVCVQAPRSIAVAGSACGDGATDATLLILLAWLDYIYRNGVCVHGLGVRGSRVGLPRPFAAVGARAQQLAHVADRVPDLRQPRAIRCAAGVGTQGMVRGERLQHGQARHSPQSPGERRRGQSRRAPGGRRLVHGRGNQRRRRRDLARAA
jgi:TPR repeat protein/thiamine monophosphate synthase